MYLTASYPIQLPEIKRTIADYHNKIYDHDNMVKDRLVIQDKFIENFTSWINKGHIKFKGLKEFKHVYITNGVTEAITITMLEHSLRPIVCKDEYGAYVCQAKAFKKANIQLNNRT